MTRLLDGRVAVITGGSSGLGRAIAIAFAAEGASVVVGDVRSDPQEGGLPTADLITRGGGSALFVRADVSVWDDIDALVGTAIARHGRLDVMVNNAAIASGTGLLDTTAEHWQQVMGVNLTGMFHGCKRAVQQMVTQEPRAEVRGRIINLGSQMGIVNSPHDTPYGVSKAGAIYLTRQIAVDYADQLIVCNCISPGKIVIERPNHPPDPEIDNARRRTPWPRLGRPQDIANGAVFLASDRATYMTGANMVIDGGWLCR
jgi:NAD(P)-dependent dehydrogenase (short-subunit alcohol dehydrogenase family)